MTSALILFALPLAGALALVLMPPGRLATIIMAVSALVLVVLWADRAAGPEFLGSSDSMARGFLTIPLALASLGWVVAAAVQMARARHAGQRPLHVVIGAAGLAMLGLLAARMTGAI